MNVTNKPITRSVARTLLSVITALMLTVSLAVPVLAIEQPLSNAVTSVYAFQHLLEPNDQMYLIVGETTYSTPPTETITQAYLGVMYDTDGVTIMATDSPDAIGGTGWGKFLIALYYSASGAPTWNQAYKFTIMGNPALAWGGPGTPPESSQMGVSVWSAATDMAATKPELANVIIAIADQLQTSWDDEELIDENSVGTRLSTDGESYFLSVIPDLRKMAPDAFRSSMADPDWSIHDYKNDLADELADKSTGTAFDFSALATAIGLSRMWTSAFLYFLLVGTILYFVVQRTMSFKPVLLVVDFAFIVGAWLGILPLSAPVGLAAVLLLIINFLIYYRPSSA